MTSRHAVSFETEVTQLFDKQMVISFHFEINVLTSGIISNIASSPAGRNKTVTEQKNGENSKARSMLLYQPDVNLKKLISS